MSVSKEQQARTVFTPKNNRTSRLGGGGGRETVQEIPSERPEGSITFEEATQSAVSQEEQERVKAERIKNILESERGRERLLEIQRQEQETPEREKRRISGFEVEDTRRQDRIRRDEEGRQRILGQPVRGQTKDFEPLQRKSAVMVASENIQKAQARLNLDKLDRDFSPAVKKVIRTSTPTAIFGTAKTIFTGATGEQSLSGVLDKQAQNTKTKTLRAVLGVASGGLQVLEKGLEKPATSSVVIGTSVGVGAGFGAISQLGKAGAVISQAVGGGFGGAFAFAKTGEAINLVQRGNLDATSQFVGKTGTELAIISGLGKAGSQSVRKTPTFTPQQKKDIQTASKKQPASFGVENVKKNIFQIEGRQVSGDAQIITRVKVRVTANGIQKIGTAVKIFRVGGQTVTTKPFILKADDLNVKGISKVLNLAVSGKDTGLRVKLPQLGKLQARNIQASASSIQLTTPQLKQINIRGGALFKVSTTDKSIINFISFGISPSNRLEFRGAGVLKRLSKPSPRSIKLTPSGKFGVSSKGLGTQTLQQTKTLTAIAGTVPSISKAIGSTVSVRSVPSPQTSFISPVRFASVTKTIQRPSRRQTSVTQQVKRPSFRQGLEKVTITKQGSGSGTAGTTVGVGVQPAIRQIQQPQVRGVTQVRTPSLRQTLQLRPINTSFPNIPNINIEAPVRPFGFSFERQQVPLQTPRGRKKRRFGGDTVFAQDLTAKQLGFKPVEVSTKDLDKLTSKAIGIRRGVKIKA